MNRHPLTFLGGAALGALLVYCMDARSQQRPTRRLPDSDEHLRQRIRARMGHLISHPKALHVEVDDGRVQLTGRVIGKELGRLLEEISAMRGVCQVRSEVQPYEQAQGASPPRAGPIAERPTLH